jgi:hypothetical protein
VISGFRRDADEICSLLGYNAALSDNPFKDYHSTLRYILEQRISQAELLGLRLLL